MCSQHVSSRASMGEFTYGTLVERFQAHLDGSSSAACQPWRAWNISSGRNRLFQQETCLCVKKRPDRRTVPQSSRILLVKIYIWTVYLTGHSTANEFPLLREFFICQKAAERLMSSGSGKWTIQSLGLIKSLAKKRSICTIRSEEAIIKRRLLRKNQDMPGQRRRSLDRQMPVKEYMVWRKSGSFQISATAALFSWYRRDTENMRLLFLELIAFFCYNLSWNLNWKGADNDRKTKTTPDWRQQYYV